MLTPLLESGHGVAQGRQRHGRRAHFGWRREDRSRARPLTAGSSRGAHCNGRRSAFGSSPRPRSWFWPRVLPRRAGQKAAAASPNVACIGRLKCRLRKACTSSAMSETEASVWPAVTSVSQPPTAAMPPDKYAAHAESSTKASVPGRHQRNTGQHRAQTVRNRRRIDRPRSAMRVATSSLPAYRLLCCGLMASLVFPACVGCCMRRLRRAPWRGHSGRRHTVAGRLVKYPMLGYTAAQVCGLFRSELCARFGNSSTEQNNRSSLGMRSRRKPTGHRQAR